MIKELIESVSLTPQEQNVITYIFDHPDCLFRYNAKELAKETYVSSPTVIRLVKKLGFKGYTDFQMTYIQEYTMYKNNQTYIINKDSTIENVMKALPHIYEEVLYETQRMINKEPFIRTINYMLQAKQIDFYANANNYSQIQTACLKLNTLGIRAQAFNTLNYDYMNTFDPKQVVSFVISHSGKNQAMIDAAYTLKKRRSRVIAITSKLDSSLSLICDESLYIDASLHHLPSHMMIYSLSVYYILDILITSLMIKKGLFSKNQ